MLWMVIIIRIKMEREAAEQMAVAHAMNQYDLVKNLHSKLSC